MKDVILTTDLYHRHADPNDHWNLASMYALAHLGYINFVGIMCDDDRSITEDGSFLHFGDPSVQSIAQLNYITGMAVPVGFGSRRPIKKAEDLDAVLAEGRKISSVTLLLNALEHTKTKVDIHMCGSCKDVLIAYHTAPELFRKKCDCIYLNAGTYKEQEPLEYNVSLEPYAFSQIFKIPCNIRWAPCFARLGKPLFVTAERANYYSIHQSESVEVMSDAMKKYFNYMFGIVTDMGWLSYLRAPLDKELLASWSKDKRQMWSTPGFLLSAGKKVSCSGEIVNEDSDCKPIYQYTPVKVEVLPTGQLTWTVTENSNIMMFRNSDPDVYEKAMRCVIKTLMSVLPDLR